MHDLKHQSCGKDKIRCMSTGAVVCTNDQITENFGTKLFHFANVCNSTVTRVVTSNAESDDVIKTAPCQKMGIRRRRSSGGSGLRRVSVVLTTSVTDIS